MRRLISTLSCESKPFYHPCFVSKALSALIVGKCAFMIERILTFYPTTELNSYVPSFGGYTRLI